MTAPLTVTIIVTVSLVI
ncbi:Protein of unknown function [Bacillus cereus]|nr:Protein of unknown function [Bacillus cereus]